MKLLHPLDIPFERRAFMVGGQLRWLMVGMPDLRRYSYLLNSVFYLYRSRDDAVNGKPQGGCGFFLGVRSNQWPDQLHHIHGITNWHVAIQQGFPVIRVNSI